MKEIPFIGGSYAGESPSADAQNTINLYLAPDDEGGRPALIGTPGLSEFIDLS